MLTFKSQGDTYFGEGCTKEALGAIFSANDYKRPMVMYDGNIALGGLTVLEWFGEMRLDCSSEPTYDKLKQVLQLCKAIYDRRKWDVIVVIGGGSALDMAKAIAILLTNEGDGIMYRGFNKVKKLGVPIIAIPTTLSGSEATNNAPFIDTETMTKMGINGRYMFAAHAILDPAWLPPKDSKAFVGTFLDAVTHAYEASICVQGNAMTKYMAEHALNELMSGDIERIQIGANVAARALCNSGSGIAGAISYPFGVHYKVPHGIAGGIFLPDVMRFNGATEMANIIDKYLVINKIPLGLAEYGVKSVDDLHAHLKQMQGAFDQNPNKFDADKDARAILMKHWQTAEVQAHRHEGVETTGMNAVKPTTRRKK
jgi:alcohol dehydrogenase class IV